MSCRRSCAARFALTVLTAALLCGKTSTVLADGPSLKDAYKNDFLIGVALGGTLPDDYSPQELAVIKSQFNAVTPENCMKPESVQPEEGKWTFKMADALVKFAEDNQMQIFGHNLVWDRQTPSWFFKDNGQPVSREKALERMKTHIDTVMGRYKGKIRGWDVVNEAASRGGSKEEDLSKSPWRTAIGDDYVIKAYQFAHEADPAAELQYNDFEFEVGAKHDNVLHIVKQLQDAGIPLAAVGIQGHYKLNSIPFEGLEKTINDLQSMGVKVMITELDLDATRLIDFGAEDQQHKAEDISAPVQAVAATMQLQAEQYAKLFEIFNRHKDAITRVTFWGLDDARSWLKYSPKGRKYPGMPLLFDDECQAKPALEAVIEVLSKRGG
jgi:endo-1,4-beta-xylanase